MRRLKRGLWKAGIAVAGMLLLLALMVWLPVSAVGPQERALGFATPVTGTVQATPTEDATVTALNKEKLAQEVQQLKNQNEPDPLGWLRTNASIFLSTLVVVVGALFGFWRWRVDRRDAHTKELEDRKAERERRDEEQRRWLEDREAEREKRAEERFQSTVEGLSSEREEAKVGATILLRTFLRAGYEQFYTQTFDLAVANLRLPRTPSPPDNPDAPLPLTTLSQALIMVFKEAFPLARSQNQDSPESLDATDIQLDNAYLVQADLKQAWMRRASMRNANLYRVILSRARLFRANFKGADLRRADLSEAYLSEANFKGADLKEADLRWANLNGANLEDALSLKDTNLRGVKGLTKEQFEACKAKGAILDEDLSTSLSQPAVSPSLSLRSLDVQAQSVPLAQGNLPTPDTGGGSAVSSEPSSQL